MGFSMLCKKLVITESNGDYVNTFEYLIKGKTHTDIMLYANNLIEDWRSDSIVNYDTKRAEYGNGSIVTWELYSCIEEDFVNNLLDVYIKEVF